MIFARESEARARKTATLSVADISLM
jgi:hypothetical protein